MRLVTWSAGALTIGCAAIYGQNLTFEVASVKPAAPVAAGERMFMGSRGGPGTVDPGHITSSNMTLKALLVNAYGVQPYQINGPAWLDTERYDIIAKVPLETTKEQIAVMWQNLLAERFGVVLHHESREFNVDELVVAKGGPKLKQSEMDPNAPPLARTPGPPKLDKNGFPELSGPGMLTMMTIGQNGPTAHTVARAQSISQLTAMLGNQLRHPVVDKTGLTGKYDFKLEFTPDMSGAPLPPPPPGMAGPPGGPPGSASDPGTNLGAAVQQQLGLRLISGKAKLDVLIIDRANKTPTEN